MESKARVRPTDYPRLPFHLLRSAQLVSSIIVSGILSYFVWQLRHDEYVVPWTFLLLLAVAALTILSLSVTMMMYFFTGLNPRLNMFSNSALLLFWSVTFALFTWWSSGTLTHACNKQNWRSSVGINVCRSFKALFTFTCVGLASTGLATYLDFRIYRKSTRLGKYGQMQAEDKLQDDDQKAGLDVSDALLAPRKAYQRESSFTTEDD